MVKLKRLFANKMKLYTKTPDVILRIKITKLKEQTKYLTVCNCTQNEAIEELKNLISLQPLNIFESHKTTIEVREAIGGKNGLTKSFSFHGLSVENTYKVIIDYLNKK